MTFPPILVYNLIDDLGHGAVRAALALDPGVVLRGEGHVDPGHALAPATLRIAVANRRARWRHFVNLRWSRGRRGRLELHILRGRYFLCKPGMHKRLGNISHGIEGSGGLHFLCSPNLLCILSVHACCACLLCILRVHTSCAHFLCIWRRKKRIGRRGRGEKALGGVEALSLGHVRSPFPEVHPPAACSPGL